ncbi:MAG: right-handed parallel beta-helix repeat-containing protein [Clostridia bacterium]|nr:right-handed parallel beta-helix repeat-containing protein [Clostridia bacterium]
MKTRIFSFILITALLITMFALPTVQADGGNIYYVSQATGRDDNPGTKERPFASIGKGKSQLKAGDTLIVDSGIYRENIVFYEQNGTADAPYTIKGAEGAEAIITTYDPVQTKWTQYDGNIYKTTLPNKPDVNHALWYTEGEFKNLVEARWPNIDADNVLLQERAIAKVGTGQNGIYDYMLPAGDWTGAKVYTWTGREVDQYVSFTRTIATYSEEDQLTFDSPVNDGGDLYTPQAGVWYYLTGALCGLDVAREYFYNNETGELYVLMPDGEKPEVDEIWVQARKDAFDYYGCSYINLENLTIIGGGVGVDSGSNHCTMDNVDVFYCNFFDNADGYTTLQKAYNGNHFHGDYNTWKNSEIAYTMTSGIMIAGNHNTVTNCYIHDINWAGGYNSGVFVEGAKAGNVISHNTLKRSGRFLIYFTYDGYDSEIRDTIIEYNDVSESDYLTYDGGCIYMYHRAAVNSVIRYNWVHDTDINGSCGIYLDNGTSGMQVYRNVVWNTNQAGIALNTPSKNNLIYHNTVFNCGQAIQGWPKDADSTQEGTQIKNNLLSGRVEYVTSALGPVVENNLIKDQLPVNNRYIPSGEAVDKAIALPGYNDSFSGTAADLGAYESGGTYWMPGANKPAVYGDLNNDTNMNASDLLLLKRHLLTVDTISLDADLDGDYKVTASDMLLLKRMLLAL